MEGDTPTIDENKMIDDVTPVGNMPPPIVEANNTVDQIMTLALVSSGCEVTGTKDERTQCMLNYIEPIEREIGKSDGVTPEQRLGDFFASHPGAADTAIKSTQDLINRGIDIAEKMTREQNDVDQV